MTHSPQMLTGFSPLNGLPTFYGLGWNVNYDTEGRLRLGHSGAFALGAATNVLLVPSEHLGIVVLTNAYPIGVAEGLAFTFTDLRYTGKLPRNGSRFSNRCFRIRQQAVCSLERTIPSRMSRPRPHWQTALIPGLTPTASLEIFRSSKRARDWRLSEGPRTVDFPFEAL